MRRLEVALLAGVAVLALLAFTTAAPRAAAQARSLSWPQVTVTARLDSAGQLHVTERQTMRLSGDWNGGERYFDLRNRQAVELRRLTRIPASGAPVELRADKDIDELDTYWESSRGRFRWRSRLPDDPVFDDDTLVYELELTFKNVLVPQSDSTFLLDHNFAMVDRDGPIDDFRVTVTLDPAWTAPADLTGEFLAGPLSPGMGYLVTLNLRHRDPAALLAANTSATVVDRTVLAGLLAVAAIFFLARLIAREARLGRFAPVPDRSAITREWLDAHVFSRLPEVVGATWDDHTAEAEVAAILARMVQEGKLSNRVTEEKVLVFTKQELHLQLLVKKGELPEHERALIDGLFEPHASSTSTTEVRERYKSTGFDPASTIRKPIAAMVGEVASGGSKPAWKPTGLLLLAGLILTGIGIARVPFDAPVAFAAIGIATGAFLLMLLFALGAQRALAKLTLALTLLTIVVAAGFGTFAFVILLDPVDALGTFTAAGLTLWMLGLMRSVFNIAMSRQSAQRIAIRKQLYAARAFFRDELAKPQPALRDEWFPWIIAFGLGRHIDKWFKAFGGTNDLARSTVIATSSGARSGGSSSAGWTGFGGGGGFSGGGSSASFAAAVGGMAASVPSPSSSSSGGGSSSGGSSGGGGGGGW